MSLKIKLALGGAALLYSFGGNARNSKKPNVIFILADDLENDEAEGLQSFIIHLFNQQNKH